MSKKKILVVDDSLSMRQMVSYTMREAGFEPIEAIDGLDALTKAKSEKFSCIITDINMPNMNGIELIKELRLLSQYKYSPILCLTTETSETRKEEGRNAGASGWLVKPFKPQDLADSIKKLVR